MVAQGDGASARVQLSDRFQKAIDAAAMKAGLVDSDAYLDEWRRETQPCGDDLEAEAAAAAERLEAAHPRDVLLALTRAGGIRSSSAAGIG